MELFKTYIYDHEIRKRLKLCESNKVQWNVKEVNTDKPYQMFKLSFSMDNNKYHVKSISYTGSLNPDIKKYSLIAMENIMDAVEQEFPNISFTLNYKSKKNNEVKTENTTENDSTPSSRRLKL